MLMFYDNLSSLIKSSAETQKYTMKMTKKKDVMRFPNVSEFN